MSSMQSTQPTQPGNPRAAQHSTIDRSSVRVGSRLRYRGPKWVLTASKNASKARRWDSADIHDRSSKSRKDNRSPRLRKMKSSFTYKGWPGRPVQSIYCRILGCARRSVASITRWMPRGTRNRARNSRAGYVGKESR